MMNRWHLTTDHMQLLPGPAIAIHLTSLSTQAEHPLWKTCSGPEDRDWGVYYWTDKVLTYLTREEIQKEERKDNYRVYPVSRKWLYQPFGKKYSIGVLTLCLCILTASCCELESPTRRLTFLDPSVLISQSPNVSSSMNVSSVSRSL